MKAGAFIAALPIAADIGGGKAASLGRLAVCGLRVPAGFVCTDVLFRLWVQHVHGNAVGLPDQFLDLLREQIRDAPMPPTMQAELSAALLALGGNRFSVRSSFALEDNADALAAGVFESAIDVSRNDVAAAVRQVLASALSPAAVAYVRARHRDILQGPMSVLVHRFIAGTASGHVAVPSRTTQPSVWVQHGILALEHRTLLEQTAHSVVSVLGSSELEWVLGSDGFTFVQWRPFVPAPPAAPWRPTANATNLTPAALGPDWQWDASHNPAPLSPAQQGLVTLVQQHCRVGFDQQVCGGYLFYKKNDSRAAPPLEPEDLDEGFLQLQDALQSDLAALPARPDLQAALSLFLRHYETLVGTVGTAVRVGKRRLQDFMDEHAPDQARLIPGLLAHQPCKATERLRLLRDASTAPTPLQADAAWKAYLAVFGDEPTQWDVAARTQRELTSPWQSSDAPFRRDSRDAAIPVELECTIAPEVRDTFTALLAAARRCVARGEDDDWLYARLQAPVRRACLALGTLLVERRLLDQADDIFFLPLELTRSLETTLHTPSAPLREMVRSAKSLHAQQAQNPPPLLGSALSAKQASTLRGHGTGGRIVGRVRHYQAGQRFTDSTEIVVATSLLPTDLPLIQAAALVVETGGALDHVAAQARERNIPALVGVTNACSSLRMGDLVLVDADAGVVVLLTKASPQDR